MFACQNLQQASADYISQLRKPADPKKDPKSNDHVIQRMQRKIVRSKKCQSNKQRRPYSLPLRSRLTNFWSFWTSPKIPKR